MEFIILSKPLSSIILTYFTPHEILIILHAIQPAIVHSSRIIFGSLYINPLVFLTQRISSVTATQKILNSKVLKVIKQISNFGNQQIQQSHENQDHQEQQNHKKQIIDSIQHNEISSIDSIIQNVRKNVQKENPNDLTTGINQVNTMLKVIQENPPPRQNPTLFPLSYLGIYLVVRYVVYNMNFSDSKENEKN